MLKWPHMYLLGMSGHHCGCKRAKGQMMAPHWDRILFFLANIANYKFESTCTGTDI